MRTPDSDESPSGAAASLADGFGAADLDEPGTDGTYGEGYSDAEATDSYGDSESALEGSGEADLSETEELAFAEGGNGFDADPGDVASDADLDFTGDGLVDAADVHEAVTGFFDFDVDPGADAADVPADQDPGGFFGA
jgi:hypothetical protein